MHPSLVGPRLKWRWANDHIASLGNKIRAFFDGDSYSVGSNFDQETEQHVIAVRISAEPPLARWSLMVGDALHNLRSALDHLSTNWRSREAAKSRPRITGACSSPSS